MRERERDRSIYPSLDRKLNLYFIYIHLRYKTWQVIGEKVELDWHKIQRQRKVSVFLCVLSGVVHVAAAVIVCLPHFACIHTGKMWWYSIQCNTTHIQISGSIFCCLSQNMMWFGVLCCCFWLLCDHNTYTSTCILFVLACSLCILAICVLCTLCKSMRAVCVSQSDITIYGRDKTKVEKQQQQQQRLE